MMAKSIFLVILSALCVSQSLRPRGVRPDMANFYDANQAFHCLDGSGDIPFAQVNDDYCDCKDGSDEPGTSACPNGQFYCANRGFKPSLLPSSRVNDGICDCCDGSDEWALIESGTGSCQNNCDELGAADRLERERLEKVIEQGLKLKAELSAMGLKARQEKMEEIDKKKVDLETFEADKEAKRIIKEEKEKLEKAALDVIREEEERLKKIREEEEKAARDAEAMAIFNEKLDKNKDGRVGKDDLILNIAFDQNNDGVVSEEEANFYMSGHDSYDQESFLSTGWLLMKHLFSQQKDTNNEETDDDPNDENVKDYDYDEDEHEEDDLEAPTIKNEEENEAVNDEDGKAAQYEPEVQALVDSANVARDEFNAANNAYNDLNHDIQQLERYLEKDFGPDDVFAPLSNVCFEYNDHEYTYKMCAFEYCAQKPINGGSETRLGSWEKWTVPHTQMSYERGVTCWNGPPRSTKVDLKCGAENKLVGASEPNRCEYLFVFETPAVCQPLPPKSIDHDEL